MLYSIFTCSRDAGLLFYSVSAIVELDPDAIIYLVVDRNEADMPLDLPASCLPHVRSAVSAFDRGHMYGLACVGGVLSTLEAIMLDEKATHVVKIDSDTILRSLEWLQGREDYIAAETGSPWTPAGNCVRVSIWGVRAALRGLRVLVARGDILPGHPYPEDQTIYQTIRDARLPVKLHRYARHVSVGVKDADLLQTYLPARLREASVLHVGEPLLDGTRAHRDHVRLRMALIREKIALTPPDAHSVHI